MDQTYNLVPQLVGNILVALKIVFTGIYENSFRFVMQKCGFMQLKENSVCLRPVLSKEYSAFVLAVC